MSHQVPSTFLPILLFHREKKEGLQTRDVNLNATGNSFLTLHAHTAKSASQVQRTAPGLCLPSVFQALSYTASTKINKQMNTPWSITPEQSEM